MAFYVIKNRPYYVTQISRLFIYLFLTFTPPPYVTGGHTYPSSPVVISDFMLLYSKFLQKKKKSYINLLPPNVNTIKPSRPWMLLLHAIEIKKGKQERKRIIYLLLLSE